MCELVGITTLRISDGILRKWWQTVYGMAQPLAAAFATLADIAGSERRIFYTLQFKVS